MVAVGDFGCGERERMVELAIEHGWVQRTAAWAAERGESQPVVVLATDTATAPGPLGRILEGVRQEFTTKANVRQIQTEAGCPPFVVLPLPLEALARWVDESTEEDLRTASARNDYAVLCMNGGNVVLISGVSRDTEADT